MLWLYFCVAHPHKFLLISRSWRVVLQICEQIQSKSAAAGANREGFSAVSACLSQLLILERVKSRLDVSFCPGPALGRSVLCIYVSCSVQEGQVSAPQKDLTRFCRLLGCNKAATSCQKIRSRSWPGVVSSDMIFLLKIQKYLQGVTS